MSKVNDAVSAFESGFNCSQAIVRTYGPDYGLSILDAIRVSCGQPTDIELFRDAIGPALADAGATR